MTTTEQTTMPQVEKEEGHLMETETTTTAAAETDQTDRTTTTTANQNLKDHVKK